MFVHVQGFTMAMFDFFFEEVKNFVITKFTWREVVKRKKKEKKVNSKYGWKMFELWRSFIDLN